MTGTFPLGTSGVFVTFDASKFTRALHDRMTDDFVERCDRETQGAADAAETAQEIDRQICADALAVDCGGILRAWGLSGVSPRPTLATLLKLPPKFPADLFKWARATAKPTTAKDLNDWNEPDARRDYSRWLVNPNLPTAAPHPRVDEYDIANFLRVSVDDLPDVPEFRIEDARNILGGRHDAAIELMNKLKVARVALISPELFIGF